MTHHTQHKRLALFDIDGTLVKGNTSRMMLDFPQISRWRIAEVYVRVLPFWFIHKTNRMSQEAFRDVFIRSIAHLVRGWERSETEQLFTWIAARMSTTFYPAVVERLNNHKTNGDHIILVSTMFDGTVAAFAKHLDADVGLGTPLVYQNNICTGQIAGISCAGSNKIKYVQQYLASQGYSADLAEGYAYADSISDLPMLSAVGHPVATYPDEKLYAIAQQQGWEIINEEQ
ncbi:MAG: HAD-IB family hydrolase [Chloroflexi bacterium]|nr:MAG: HAD-IB family hydrolase [Phototrophicales bacterium]RMF81636.1 MAG: HAD-IB family hydrolase [Chloroflexota bacterium]